MKCPFCNKEMVNIDIVPEALDPNVVYSSHPLPFIGNWLRIRMNQQADSLRKELRAETCTECGFFALFRNLNP